VLSFNILDEGFKSGFVLSILLNEMLKNALFKMIKRFISWESIYFLKLNANKILAEANI